MLIKEREIEQSKAIKSAIKDLKEYKKTYLEMATGTGKTHVAVQVMKQMIKKGDVKTVGWLTATHELIRQTYLRLQEDFKDVGFFTSSKTKYSNIMVLSIDKLKFGFDENQHYDLIIVDEAHHAPAEGWSRVISRYKCKYLLGLTATPNRLDGKTIDEFFGDPCYQLDFSDAQEKGILSKHIARVILTNDKIHLPKSGDYQARSLKKLATSKHRCNLIVQAYKKHRSTLKKNKTICFCINTHHAEIMQKYFAKAGIKALAFTSKLNKKSRNDIYQMFKNNYDIEILCVVNILNEGKDIPLVNTLLMARPTLSPTIYCQQVGRASRIVPGENDTFLLLDFVDNTKARYRQMSSGNTLGTDITRDKIDISFVHLGSEIEGEEIINDLMEGYKEFRSFTQFNPETCITLAQNYYKKHKAIKTDDFRLDNMLPSRKKIVMLFGSFKNFFDQADIPYRPHRSWTKESIYDRCLEYYKEHKQLNHKDLVYENNMPSSKVVRSYYGKTSNLFDLIKGEVKEEIWTREKMIKVAKNYFKKNKNIVTKDLVLTNGLPSQAMIKIEFGSIGTFMNIVKNKKGWTEKEVLEACAKFYKKNKRLYYNDLRTDNKMPSAQRVKKLFGSVSNLVKIIKNEV